MPELNDWDINANNNNSASPDGFPENMNYSGVNNSAREVMAVVKRWFADTNGSLVTAGAVNAYTVTMNAGYTSYFTGLRVTVQVHIGNTGATTLDANGIGAAAIKDVAGNDLGAGDMTAGGIYELVHDGIDWQLTSDAGAGSAVFSSLTVTGSAEFGVDDDTAGLVTVYGDGAGSTVGGRARYYTAADHDSTIQSYDLGADSADFVVLQNGVARIQVQGLSSQHVRLLDNAGGIGLSVAGVGGSVGIGADPVSGVKFYVNSGASNVVARFESTDPVAVIELADDTTTAPAALVRVGDDLALWSGNAAQLSYDDSADEWTAEGNALWAGNNKILLTSFGDNGVIQNGLREIAITFVQNAGLSLYYDSGEEFTTRDSNANYNTSGAQVRDHGQTFRDVGFNVMPVIEQDTSTSLDENDVGKILHKDAGGAITITLPSGSSGAVPPIGSTVMFANEDAEDTTITAAGTLRWFNGSGAPATGNRLLGQGGVCTMFKYASTEWWVWGNGLS